MLALNAGDEAYNTIFNISLPGEWVAAVPLDGGGAIAISSGQFSDYFNQYDVIVYELVQVPEPTLVMLLISGLGVLLLARRRSSRLG